MALPTGFDPNNMTLGPISAPRPRVTPTRNPTTQNTIDCTNYLTEVISRPRTTTSQSLWQRFNEAIKHFGNWIDDHLEQTGFIITALMMIGAAIGLLCWIFSDSDLIFIILRFIGACIVGYVLLILIFVASWVIGMGLKLIRFVFWNGWTLLITIAILGFWTIYSSGPNYEEPLVYDAPTEIYPSYQVTANELNIRSSATTNSRVLGRFYKGDIIQVKGTYNGFAIIDYNGNTGYVSEKYINPLD